MTSTPPYGKLVMQQVRIAPFALLFVLIYRTLLSRSDIDATEQSTSP